MKKQLGVILTLVIIVTAVLLTLRKSQKDIEDGSRYCPIFQSKLNKVTGQIASHDSLQIVYAFPLEYKDGKNPDFILTELQGDFWKDKRSPHPRLRYIKNLGDGKFVEDESFPVFETLHARHLIPVELTEGRGFIFADHGLDAPPFAGAFPRIILKQKNGTWKEFTKELLPQNPSFNFHVNILNTDKNKPDIFVSVVSDTRKGLGSYLLKNDGHDHFSVSDKIPEDLRKGDLCFMTNHVADLGGDGQKEIIIGGCDRPPGTKMASRDRILHLVNGSLEYAPEESLPLRAKDESWGTVAIATADLNHDGHTDIVEAIHNFGFTQGAIQVHMNTGKDLKFRRIAQSVLEPAEKDKTSFIPWVRVGDLDGDGLPEILAPITPIFKDGKDPKLEKNFALYKNVDGDHFANVAPCLGSTLPYISDVEFMDLNNDGKLDILLLSSDGHYEIYYNKF